MCGILGVLDPAGPQPRDTFPAALDRLRLRGPDDSGIWHESPVTLGHRRLSIVDLSPTGHQPMLSSDCRYVIVFNGEIYNHAELRNLLNPPGGWRGTSDTETLLEAYRRWGVECLQHLNGMFAFAIWDCGEKTLFLARDRMGVKPLYYAERGRMLAFASRPAALTTLLGDAAIQIDEEGLRAYLELGYVPAPLSFHAGIRKLAPGHYLIADSRGARCVRYWDFRAIEPDPTWAARAEGDLVEELHGLVLDAVRARLMSDVLLGAFLSGGVDSALVVAAMKAAGVERPRAFTIGFRETAFDEGPAAARIAEHLGIDHIVEIVGVNELLELLPTYAEQYDEPFADGSAFPTMAVARLARRHVTVALSGDGADEIFGGYHYYPLMNRLLPLLRWPESRRRIAQLVLRRLPLHRARLLAGALSAGDAVGLFNYLRGVNKDYPSVLSEELRRPQSFSANLFEKFADGFAASLGGEDVAMRLDAGFTLPDLFLQKVDVATMAFSLEARCPMTDYRLVEWSMRLPLQYKLRDGQTKYLLKKALCRYLPADLVYRKKMGFAMPIAAWLRGPLRSWAEELIHDDTLMSSLPLDRQRVRQLHLQQLRGERESHPLLWSVLMLLCFMRHHGSAGPRVAASYRRVA